MSSGRDLCCGKVLVDMGTFAFTELQMLKFKLERVNKKCKKGEKIITGN